LVISGSAISLVSSVQTLAFGNVAQGVPVNETFTLTNNGASAATVNTTFPTNFGFASTTGNCVNGTSVSAGGTCQMTVAYSPTSGTALGALQAGTTITIENGSTASTDVPLAVTANTVMPAALSLYGFGDVTGQIELGAVPLSTPTGVLTLWFQNTGGIAATGLAATFSSASSSAYAIPTENPGTCLTSGAVLNPGATCSVNVQTTPTGNTVGDIAATLTLAATAVAGQSVALHATAISPSSSIYITALTGSGSSLFTYTEPTAPAGDTEYFTLHNNSSTTFNISSTSVLLDSTYGTPKVSSDFVVNRAPTTVPAGQACGATLGAGQTCTFSVTFTPAWDATNGTARLYRFAAVEVVSGATVDALGLIGRVQMPATVALSATSTSEVTVTGTTANFGQIVSGQTAPSLVFTLTNVGDVATASAPTLTVAGAPWAYVPATGNTCTGALAAQGTCTITVASQFTAVGALSSGSAQGMLGSVASGGAFTLEATGGAVLPAQLSVPSPSSTSFGTLAVGATPAQITLNVTNVNGAASSPSTLQATGTLGVTLSDATDFKVDQSSTCLATATTYVSLGTSSNSSESCTIIVDFSPASAGALSTTVTVTASPGGSQGPITLTGTGSTSLTVSPTTTTTSQQVFGITYGGSGASTTGLLRATLSGTNASAFAITDDSCFGMELTGSSTTCSVTVTFTGTSSTTTAQTATLTVTDGSATNTVSATLSVGG